MSSGVRKVFTILIVVVLCIVLGAFALNVLLPNVTNALVTSVENGIYSATGISLDLNGDGVSGSANNTSIGSTVTSTPDIGVGVSGFGGGTP